MKKLIVLLISCLIWTNLFSQLVIDSLCTDFETPAFFISNLSGSWQIGSPEKTVFNESYSLTNSIVTDTINPYPINDTSIFYGTYAPEYVENYLNMYYPFRIDLFHRFDTDSLEEYGLIEVSIDGGNDWADLLTTEYLDDGYFTDDLPGNTHVNLISQDSTFDNLIITGNSNGWIHSIITFDVDGFNTYQNPIVIDSIMVKFTFISDSEENFNDGWQIDKLCIRYLNYNVSGVESISKNVEIFPNPATSQITIQSENSWNNASFTLYNSLGIPVKQTNKFNNNITTIDVDDLADGMYYLELKENEQTKVFKKIIIAKR